MEGISSNIDVAAHNFDAMLCFGFNSGPFLCLL